VEPCRWGHDIQFPVKDFGPEILIPTENIGIRIKRLFVNKGRHPILQGIIYYIPKVFTRVYSSGVILIV
jgi:hypothetical protein